jgi:ornithine cyclodeaminase/alanine dehydrogenase-like protein (mu-crystallin family)
MADPTVRLHHGDMVRALQAIDLLDVLAQELVRPVTGAPDRHRTNLFLPDPGTAATTELTAVADVQTRRIGLLPTPSLQMICLAGLAGLAARELSPPGVLTAAVLGSGAAAQLQLGVIARYVRNVSHAALYPPPEEPTPPELRDQLADAGITLSISGDAHTAAAGANLLVIAERGWNRLDLGSLRPGVLAINASRRDLPDEVLADVDQVYVDDLGLLEHNQHRKFVRMHLFGSGTQPGSVPQAREGWHRRSVWRDQQRIRSDLSHVLTGRHRRTDADDVVLVELLGGPSLDIWLASHIYQAAIRLGPGC